MARNHTRKGRKLRLRNVLLLGTMLLIFVGCIVAVNILKSDVPVLLPERLAQQDAIRQDVTKNAYFKLAEANKMIPVEPLSLLVPDPDYPDERMEYTNQEGSIGDMIRVKRPDDDELLLQFLKNSEPLVKLLDQIPESAEFINPNFTTSMVMDYWDDEYLNPNYVLLIHLAYGITQILQWNDIEGGLSTLAKNTGLRSTYLHSTPASNGWFRHSPPRRSILLMLYRKSDDPILRDTLRELMVSSTKPFPDPQEILDSWLGIIDETFKNPERLKEGPRGRDIENSIKLLELGAFAKQLKTRLPELREIAALQPSEYSVMIDEGEWDNLYWLDFNNLDKHLMRTLFDRLSYAHNANAVHSAIPLAFALEDFRREHSEYPETAAQLAPDYIAEIPINPITGVPFEYFRDESRYYIGGSYKTLSGRDGETYFSHTLPETE
jgi:hypothetical protein